MLGLGKGKEWEKKARWSGRRARRRGWRREGQVERQRRRQRAGSEESERRREVEQLAAARVGPSIRERARRRMSECRSSRDVGVAVDIVRVS